MLEKLPEVVGHVLRDTRAGLDQTAFQRLRLRGGMGAIEVRSLAFADHGPIPEQYTADGVGRSPPLHWTGVPATAASVLLLVEDADAPMSHPLVHAIAVDLEPADGSLPEGALNRGGRGEEGDDDVHLGRNSFFFSGWLPPDPPPGHGTHRYAFQVFALGPGEPFSGTPGRDVVLEALQARAIASGCLIGTYARPDGSIRDDATVRAEVGNPLLDGGTATLPPVS